MNTKSTNPIAVFDSGLGGVSVLKQLHKIMPNENYIYFGDSKNAPYGSKSHEEIFEFTSAAVGMLKNMGAKIVVIACNTATAVAAAAIREQNPSLPIIGIEPALKPAVLSGNHMSVAVMATPRTLKEEKLALLMTRFGSNATIIKVPAPKIVNLVESGQQNSDEMDKYLDEVFAPFSHIQFDAVVLGCTHFPFAKQAILKHFDNRVKIFDGAEGTARQTKRVLESLNLLSSQNEGKVEFLNSDERKIALEKELFEGT